MAKDHIVDYDTTAGNNTDVDGVDTGEGTAPSNVNDAMREMMADTAEWYGDIGGSLVSGGAAGAYTLTTNDSVAAYAQAQMYVFEANHAMPDTATATLNINAIGAKPLRKNVSLNLAAGDIATNGIVAVAYEGATDTFQILSVNGKGSEFAAGTDMVFYEDAAPTGWTIVAGVDEHAIRLSKGSVAGGEAAGATGGTNNFSTQFATLAEGATPGVGDHTISIAEMPAHTHPNSIVPVSGNEGGFDGNVRQAQINASNAALTIASQGGGGAHGHTVDLRVKWAACIIATKD